MRGTRCPASRSTRRGLLVRATRFTSFHHPSTTTVGGSGTRNASASTRTNKTPAAWTATMRMRETRMRTIPANLYAMIVTAVRSAPNPVALVLAVTRPWRPERARNTVDEVCRRFLLKRAAWVYRLTHRQKMLKPPARASTPSQDVALVQVQDIVMWGHSCFLRSRSR